MGGALDVYRLTVFDQMCFAIVVMPEQLLMKTRAKSPTIKV
jgi:hypothetical protein